MKSVDITVFGDSIAKGLEIKKGRPTSLKENAVDLVASHYNIQITNKSSFGQSISRLKEKGLIDEYLKKINKKNRNIVVFCIGGNDCDFDWKAIDQSPNEEHCCKTKLEDFIAIYYEMIDKLRKKKVEIYICALPVVCSRAFFNKYVCAIAEKKNILEFLEHDTSKISRHQEIYNNALRDICQAKKVVFLDIRTPFLKVKNIEKYYCDDGLHPNEEGQRLIAETIIKFFGKYEKGTV